MLVAVYFILFVCYLFHKLCLVRLFFSLPLLAVAVSNRCLRTVASTYHDYCMLLNVWRHSSIV